MFAALTAGIELGRCDDDDDCTTLASALVDRSASACSCEPSALTETRDECAAPVEAEVEEEAGGGDWGGGGLLVADWKPGGAATPSAISRARRWNAD